MTGWPVRSLCQIAAVRARRRCRILVMTPSGVAAVAFEAGLAFEGVVDGFDDLAQRLEEAGACPLRLALAGRAQPADAVLGQGGLEVVPVVVLVRDDDLAVPAGGQGRAGPDAQEHLPLVCLGAGQAKPAGSPCRVHSRCRRNPQK